VSGTNGTGNGTGRRNGRTGRPALRVKDRVRAEQIAEGLMARALPRLEVERRIRQELGCSIPTAQRVCEAVRERWRLDARPEQREERRADMLAMLLDIARESRTKQKRVAVLDKLGQPVLDASGMPMHVIVEITDNKTAVRALDVASKLLGLQTVNVTSDGPGGALDIFAQLNAARRAKAIEAHGEEVTDAGALPGDARRRDDA